MGVAVDTTDGGSKELADLIHQLNGRVVGKMVVVDGKTGERSQMVSFDFDERDTVEVVFEGIPPLEGEEEVFTYSFPKQFENVEAGPEMARNGYRESSGKQTPENLEAALGEALRKGELEHKAPTYEDYLVDYDVHIQDLSPQEKNKVLIHELDNLLDLYESLGFSEEEKKKKNSSLFSKLFS